nr:hemolysin III family protein [uncultured Pseudokineococcus sp.]
MDEARSGRTRTGSSVAPGSEDVRSADPSTRGEGPGDVDHDGERTGGGVRVVKPLLRGWLHLGMFPLVLAAGVVGVALAPTTASRWAMAVFGLTAAMLFGISALYHRGSWSPRAQGVLKRFDHSNIFLIIAGTYTPFAVLLLEPGPQRLLLLVAWLSALAGIAFRIFWVGAPRWLYVPAYLAMGWVAVAFLPQFLEGGGTAVLVLIAVGGLLYTAGAVVYGLKRPDPSPRYFGFHEIFHALTVVAFTCHYVAVSLALHSGQLPGA